MVGAAVHPAAGRARQDGTRPDGSDYVRVLDEDPELARSLPAESSALARRHAVAREKRLGAGPWEPQTEPEGTPCALGLLVLDGLLTRDVVCAGRECLELLGRGDLLRPWDYSDGVYAPVPFDTSWCVLQPTRLAVLDRRFTLVVGRFPELLAELVSRTLHRSRWLSLLFALSHVRRIDQRLLILFWHLADRWGRVEREGVVLPLGLTHETLAKLVGAQRPSVTVGLSQLREQGRLRRRPDGSWLLLGSAPEEFGRPVHAGAWEATVPLGHGSRADD